MYIYIYTCSPQTWHYFMLHKRGLILKTTNFPACGFFISLMENFQEMGSKKLDEYCVSMDSSFSSTNDSVESSSSELADDASSPSSPDSSSPQLGPLFELADLMSQLPIKRGLSKYYHGKSQTFGSLASVKSLEDLAKKESSYMERMKSCKSYGGNLNHHKFGPKATIAKKCPRTSFSPSLGTKVGTNMVVNCRN